MKKLAVMSIGGLWCMQSFAMFCPNNMNQISIGDSIQQVELFCGKPTAQKSYKVEPKGFEEWNYYIKMVPGMPGTIRMVVTLNEDKVVNVNVNGMGVTATQICGGNITLGLTGKQVKTACGSPASIDKPQTTDAAKATDAVEFKYEGNSPMTLIFENGKLKERKP